MSAQPKPAPGVSLRDLAKRSVIACHGDLQKSARHLETLLRKDMTLFESVICDLVSTACMEAVTSVRTAFRAAVWRSDGPAPDQASGRVVALALGNRDLLMHYELSSGKRLNDVTGAEVRIQADIYRKFEGTFAWKRRWFDLMADKVAPRQMVRSVLTEEDVRKLKDKAKRGA